MKNFIETYRQFIELRELLDSYRFCWLHYANKWMVMEFFDDEIEKIDRKKIELVVI